MSKATTPFRGKAKNVPVCDTFMLPYQAKWIADQSILKIMEKSRRIGISYSTAYGIVREHSNKNCRNDTWVSSRDEPTAKLFVRDCMAFARILHTAARDLGEKIIEKESAYVVSFSNNTDINSVASNPDVFAGKGGNVVLDELALRKDPRGVYAIASPTIDWGGGLSIISTHRGSHNYYNELLEEIKHKGNPKGFSHHRVTLQDALDQGFLYKVQTKLRDGDRRLDMTEADYFDYLRARAPDEDSFMQEYMCVPSDDATAFLSYDLIGSCELRHPDTMRESVEETVDFVGRKGKIRILQSYDTDQIPTLPFDLYTGVDIGRDHDLTVMWVAARTMGILLPVYIVEMYNCEFSRQEYEFEKILNWPRMRRACVDNTGIGKQFAERAQQKYGVYRVEPVTFTGPVKESLAYPVKAAFEDRTMRVPDDDLVRADLRAIKKSTTDAGNIRFAADRGKNGHADRFWALALMVSAARQTGLIENLTSTTVTTRSISLSRSDSYKSTHKNILPADFGRLIRSYNVD